MLYGRPVMNWLLNHSQIHIVRSCEEFEQLVKQYDLMNETIIGVDGEWTRKVLLMITCYIESVINCTINIP